MQIIPAQLCFRGQRNYLHGSDIYTAIIQNVLNSGSEKNTSIFRMSIHSFADQQCAIHLCAKEETPAKPENTVVEFFIQSDSENLTGWLAKTEHPVTCRIPYHEDEIQKLCTISGQTITINKDSKYSPVEVAVSMTKQLHQSLYPTEPGKWIGTSRDLHRLLKPNDGSRLQIKLKHNLNHRLTKSSINVSGATIGHIYFSLVMPP